MITMTIGLTIPDDLTGRLGHCLALACLRSSKHESGVFDRRYCSGLYEGSMTRETMNDAQATYSIELYRSSHIGRATMGSLMLSFPDKDGIR